jgi:hypothetical protein
MKPGAESEPANSQSGESGGELSGQKKGTKPETQTQPGERGTEQSKKPSERPESDSNKPGEDQPQANDGSGSQKPQLPTSMPSKEAIRRMAEQFRKLADAPKDAAAQRRQAREMRKQAEELLKSATPEQREQINRWAQEMAKEMGKDGRMPTGRPPTGDDFGNSAGPGRRSSDRGSPDSNGAHSDNDHARSPEDQSPARTDTVDARPPTPAERAERSRERVIAEWYADRKAEEPGTGVVRGSGAVDAESAAQAAAREGERAVESQAVPSRFDKLLLKYFQRLPERAKPNGPSASPAPKKPEAAAQDAGTGGASGPDKR